MRLIDQDSFAQYLTLCDVVLSRIAQEKAVLAAPNATSE
jgi:hypothetical protein